MRARVGLPAGLSDAAVEAETGRVPRMLLFLQRAWERCGASGEPALSPEELVEQTVGDFRKEAESYYLVRVTRLVSRSEDVGDSLFVHSVLVHHMRDGDPWQGALPAGWETGGLFYQPPRSAVWVPTCPSVMRAFFRTVSRVLHGSLSEVAKVLAKNNHGGEAFELLGLARFSAVAEFGSSLVTLSGLAPLQTSGPESSSADRGGRLFSEVDVTLALRRLVRLREDGRFVSSGAESRVSGLRVGDVVVCPRNFPVVDYVLVGLLDGGVHLYFLQFSVQRYVDHDTKAADLVVTRQARVLGGRSVLRFFAEHVEVAGAAERDSLAAAVLAVERETVPSGQELGSLPSCASYVYVTTVAGPGAWWASPYAAGFRPLTGGVLLVGREHLLGLLGPTWVELSGLFRA